MSVIEELDVRKWDSMTELDGLAEWKSRGITFDLKQTTVRLGCCRIVHEVSWMSQQSCDVHRNNCTSCNSHK